MRFSRVGLKWVEGLRRGIFSERIKGEKLGCRWGSFEGGIFFFFIKLKIADLIFSFWKELFREFF